MEWKLERTARRRVRTEEEILWVSNALPFPCPSFLNGFLVEVTVCDTCLGPRGSSELLNIILNCVIYILEVVGCFKSESNLTS